AAKAPKDTRPLMLLAELQELQKDFPAAQKSYERVVAIDPKAGIALNNLAHLYSEKAGDVDRALEAAEKAREILPNVPEVADTLGWILYKKRMLPRSLALIEEAETQLRDNAVVKFHLG